MTTTVELFAPMDYVRALEAAGVETPWIPDRLAHGQAYAQHGPSYTIRIDGQIAAVLGLIILWPGKATAWAVWTPLGYRHPGTVHRLTIRYLRMLIHRERIIRLEAEVIDEFDAAHHWLERLGFAPEGPPRLLAGPQGETMQAYVWLHPDAPGVAPRRVSAPLEAVRRPDGSVIPAIAGGYDGGASIYIMVALTVLAASASAYASYSAAQAQKKGHEREAKVMENQAQIAQQQREQAARMQRAHDRKVMAAARAAQGVTGLEEGAGSSLLVDIENARQAALNAEQARYTGEAQVGGLRDAAGLQRWQGGVAGQQGTIGAGATLLGGLASGASTMYRYRTPSPTPNSITVQPTGGLDYP